MTGSRSTLVCFAVKEEASHFRKRVGSRSDVGVLLTGVGRRNAEKTLTALLDNLPRPDFVITAGFAGGLHPDLARNSIVFSAPDHSEWHARLSAAGGRYVQFHCADRIVTTAGEKRALRASTGCEAVEMESQFIVSLCARHRISAVTVRVILDTADEDLPLDFNELMDARQCINSRKLAMRLLKSPWLIRPLLRLQRHSAAASWRLGEILNKVLSC